LLPVAAQLRLFAHLPAQADACKMQNGKQMLPVENSLHAIGRICAEVFRRIRFFTVFDRQVAVL
jgi:hypothetical protein